MMHDMPHDDHEAAMAKSELYRAAKYAMKLFEMIQEGDELEGWVQGKVTKASDYLASVYHYLEYETKFKHPQDSMDMAPMGGDSEEAMAFGKTFEEMLSDKLDAALMEEKYSKIVKEAKKKNDGNLANNAKPYDKVTRGDVIAGRLGKDEMGGKDEKVKEGAMSDLDADRKERAYKTRQANTTMKHVKDPTPGEKKAAKDIKPGIKGYSDRVAMLKSAEKDGRLKESDKGDMDHDGKDEKDSEEWKQNRDAAIKKSQAKSKDKKMKETSIYANEAADRPDAKKTDTTWTDKSGKKHPATKVQGSKSVAADKDADKERKDLDKMKEAADRPDAKKTDTTWTDKSGKKHPATKVQGSKSVAADKDADKERKDLDKMKEAANPAQQAAIAIAKKKKEKQTVKESVDLSNLRKLAGL